jgi:hypothetical protein
MVLPRTVGEVAIRIRRDGLDRTLSKQAAAHVETRGVSSTRRKLLQ